MKVLHVCFADNVGGAFIGAHRLHSCMVSAGIDSELLVIKKRTSDPRVRVVSNGIKLQNFLWRTLSRFILYLQRTPDNEFRSLNIFPTSISKIINRHDADIVQLHWISNNTIGISDFKKINKPIVWKLPDMWAFCGCEHYTVHENRYRDGYTKMNRPVDHRGPDFDRYCWEFKRKHWQNLELTVVCPSKWLAGCARNSVLFKNYRVHNIPNPIDIDIFKPAAEITAVRDQFNLPHDKKLILFSSMAKASYTRKGFSYFDECIRLFSESVDPSLYKIVLMGMVDPKSGNMHGIEVLNLGKIMDINKVALAYSVMDVAVVPSEADNLPNVIKEAMACGIPCLAFDTGGVPDMIEHMVNGYLAPAGNCSELATGLQWLLANNRSEVRKNARNAAIGLHGHVNIVNKYLEIYKSLI